MLDVWGFFFTLCWAPFTKCFLSLCFLFSFGLAVRLSLFSPLFITRFSLAKHSLCPFIYTLIELA